MNETACPLSGELNLKEGTSLALNLLVALDSTIAKVKGWPEATPEETSTLVDCLIGYFNFLRDHTLEIISKLIKLKDSFGPQESLPRRFGQLDAKHFNEAENALGELVSDFVESHGGTLLLMLDPYYEEQ